MIAQKEAQLETLKELLAFGKPKATVNESTDPNNENFQILDLEKVKEDVVNHSLTIISPAKELDYLEHLRTVLNHHIKQASKISEIQTIFFEVTTIDLSYTRMKVYLQELVDKNEIVAIEFNNSRNYTFCGLPNWIIETERGAEFKEPFGPRPSHIPNGVEEGRSVSIIR